MSNDLLLRPATEGDIPTIFRLFLRSIRDLAFRQGTRDINDGQDPEEIDTAWKQRQSIFEHLARTAHRFWVAERDGEMLGYARSILRDGMLELTEFFVLPEAQSDGIGRDLLRCVFDGEGVRFRTILASTDVRAQSRYLKAGVYPLFPVCHLSRNPRLVSVDSNLRFESMEATPATLSTLGELDTAVLGFRRDVDHEWFLGNRNGFLVYRGSLAVGYGYVSRGFGSGPFAVQDSADMPAVLARAETVAILGGLEEITLHVPMINRSAIDYLIGNGYLLDPSFMFYMSDHDTAHMDRYIITGPPYFV